MQKALHHSMSVFRSMFAVALLGPWFSATAATLYQEDFSDVSDWQVIYNPNAPGDTLSNISSDGNLGTLFVETTSNDVAFGPIQSGPSAYAAFNPVNKSDYSLIFTVDSLTFSVSYDIALDQFDSGGNYLSTVVGVVPQGTFVGTDSINLGSFSFDGSAARLAPKITVHTGAVNGNQSVVFDDIHINQNSGGGSGAVPEPSSFVLMTFGAVCLTRWKRKQLA